MKTALRWTAIVLGTLAIGALFAGLLLGDPDDGCGRKPDPAEPATVVP